MFGRSQRLTPAGTTGEFHPRLGANNAMGDHMQSFAAPFPYALSTSFVGRQEEFRQATSAIRRGARLVTLIGPGGVGKTRLAVRIANALAGAYQDGTVFVPLAPVTNAELVLPAIGATVDIREIGGQPDLQSLISVLQGRELLLVLDNFEQVIAAGDQVAELIAHCPGLTALVTSRTALHVYGERLLPVPPLGLPDRGRDVGVAAAADAPAVRLFVDRAQAVDPRFGLTAANAGAVAEICRRLDGLPLAIELAAARIAHLTPTALMERMNPSLPMLTGGARDLPKRLQTVRSAIAWSYDLLPPAEKRLFRKLGVFAGGFTLEAAEAVAEGDDFKAQAVLDGIATLVAQNLVRFEHTTEAELSYSMLEPIREFAAEHLSASTDSDSVPSAHAQWCVTFCERAQRGFGMRDQKRWLRQTEREQPNIRAALQWSLAGGDSEPGLRICRALGWFWWALGDPREGKRWLEKALAQTSLEQAMIQAWLQVQLAEVLWSLGDYDAAADLDHRALATFQIADNRSGIAAVLLNLGRIAQDIGDYPASRAFYEQSLTHFRAIDDPSNVVRCLANLGMANMFEGNLEEAARLQEEALRFAKKGERVHNVAKIAFNLGEVQRLRGNFAKALANYEESLTIHEELRERRFIAEALRGLARVAAKFGEEEAAAVFAGADEATREAIAAGITPEPERVAYEAVISVVRESIGDAAFAGAGARGRLFQDGDGESVSWAICRLHERVREHQDTRLVKPGGLSTRELEVLDLLARGMSDREIGDTLFISHRTVNGHVVRIFEKLGINTRTEAAMEAVKMGIVPD